MATIGIVDEVARFEDSSKAQRSQSPYHVITLLLLRRPFRSGLLLGHEEPRTGDHETGIDLGLDLLLSLAQHLPRHALFAVLLPDPDGLEPQHCNNRSQQLLLYV